MFSMLTKTVVLPLLKSYLVKLATQEFAHYVLFEILEALAKSTKTKEDDKWVKKIKDTVK